MIVKKQQIIANPCSHKSGEIEYGMIKSFQSLALSQQKTPTPETGWAMICRHDCSAIAERSSYAN